MSRYDDSSQERRLKRLALEEQLRQLDEEERRASLPPGRFPTSSAPVASSSSHLSSYGHSSQYPAGSQWRYDPQSSRAAPAPLRSTYESVRTSPSTVDAVPHRPLNPSTPPSLQLPTPLTATYHHVPLPSPTQVHDYLVGHMKQPKGLHTGWEIDGRVIDVFRLFSAVVEAGGSSQVTANEQWTAIANAVGLSSISSSSGIAIAQHLRVFFLRTLGGLEVLWESTKAADDRSRASSTTSTTWSNLPAAQSSSAPQSLPKSRPSWAPALPTSASTKEQPGSSHLASRQNVSEPPGFHHASTSSEADSYYATGARQSIDVQRMQAVHQSTVSSRLANASHSATSHHAARTTPSVQRSSHLSSSAVPRPGAGISRVPTSSSRTTSNPEFHTSNNSQTILPTTVSPSMLMLGRPSSPSHTPTPSSATLHRNGHLPLQPAPLHLHNGHAAETAAQGSSSSHQPVEKVAPLNRVVENGMRFNPPSIKSFEDLVNSGALPLPKPSPELQIDNTGTLLQQYARRCHELRATIRKGKSDDARKLIYAEMVFWNKLLTILKHNPHISIPSVDDRQAQTSTHPASLHQSSLNNTTATSEGLPTTIPALGDPGDPKGPEPGKKRRGRPPRERLPGEKPARIRKPKVYPPGVEPPAKRPVIRPHKQASMEGGEGSNLPDDSIQQAAPFSPLLAGTPITLAHAMANGTSEAIDTNSMTVLAVSQAGLGTVEAGKVVQSTESSQNGSTSQVLPPPPHLTETTSSAHDTAPSGPAAPISKPKNPKHVEAARLRWVKRREALGLPPKEPRPPRKEPSNLPRPSGTPIRRVQAVSNSAPPKAKINRPIHTSVFSIKPPGAYTRASDYARSLPSNTPAEVHAYPPSQKIDETHSPRKVISLSSGVHVSRAKLRSQDARTPIRVVKRRESSASLPAVSTSQTGLISLSEPRLAVSKSTPSVSFAAQPSSGPPAKRPRPIVELPMKSALKPFTPIAAPSGLLRNGHTRFTLLGNGYRSGDDEDDTDDPIAGDLLDTLPLPTTPLSTRSKTSGGQPVISLRSTRSSRGSDTPVPLHILMSRDRRKSRSTDRTNPRSTPNMPQPLATRTSSASSLTAGSKPSKSSGSARSRRSRIMLRSRRARSLEPVRLSSRIRPTSRPTIAPFAKTSPRSVKRRPRSRSVGSKGPGSLRIHTPLAPKSEPSPTEVISPRRPRMIPVVELVTRRRRSALPIDRARVVIPISRTRRAKLIQRGVYDKFRDDDSDSEDLSRRRKAYVSLRPIKQLPRSSVARFARPRDPEPVPLRFLARPGPSILEPFKSILSESSLLNRCTEHRCGWKGCDAVLGSEVLLQRHVNARNHAALGSFAAGIRGTETLWRCRWKGCEEPCFSTIDDLKQHITARHISRTLICPYPDCGLTSPNVSHLSRHVMKQHDEDQPLPDSSLHTHLPPPFPIPLDQPLPEAARTDLLACPIILGTAYSSAYRREWVRHKVQTHCLAGDDPVVHVEHPPHMLEHISVSSESVPDTDPVHERVRTVVVELPTRKRSLLGL
ncbi:hypothetical protein BCR39DRAFT_554918 [Naematelia encephala]|uniref:ARID domain-containing protein n=1 Tax=Naematelia encephala TaxID=71784 RepID=A0A1Y2ADW7_9TREE|nr:hypothetical protein BCR39DRAFT_554918 [Naematelia encephala]